MTASTKGVPGLERNGEGALPSSLKLDLKAALLPYFGWLMARDSSAVGVAITAVPNLICVGAADGDVAKAGVADGDADVPVAMNAWNGYANSDGAGDSFAETDFGKVAWGVDNATIGKLSNLSGANRSMVGIFAGIKRNGKTILWTGLAAWFLARAIHMADNALFGSHVYAVDAGAATDLTEIIFSGARAKFHGRITSIQYIPNATLAATGGTDFKTLTVTKYAADGTTPVVVGTMTTVLVQTKWVAKEFTLSAVAGALDILEGDIFTIQNSHGGSGAVTPAGIIRILGKVQ